MEVRPIELDERPWMLDEIRERWHGTAIARRGTTVAVERLPALVALDGGERVGLLCYAVDFQGLEVVTIDAFLPGLGIGSALLEGAAETGRVAGCSRMWLVTTNDNVSALSFYLRRGMRMVTVHFDAVLAARVMKPELPERGEEGIAISDEIELERWL